MCCLFLLFHLYHFCWVSFFHFLSLVFVMIHIEIFLLLFGVLLSLSFMLPCDSLQKQVVHFSLIWFNDSSLFVMSVVVVSLLLLVIICIVIFLSSPYVVSFLFMSHHIVFFLFHIVLDLLGDIDFTSLSYHLSSSLVHFIYQIDWIV